MNQDKLTPEQVQHEHLRIMGDYLDAKEVIKAKRDKKLDALRERCPHEDVDDVGESIQPQPWCNDCESGVRERAGVAIAPGAKAMMLDKMWESLIEDSIPIPDDPGGHNMVKVVLDSGGD